MYLCYRQLLFSSPGDSIMGLGKNRGPTDIIANDYNCGLPAEMSHSGHWVQLGLALFLSIILLHTKMGSIVHHSLEMLKHFHHSMQSTGHL